MSKLHYRLRFGLLCGAIFLDLLLILAEFHSTPARISHIDSALTNALLALLIVNVWRPA